MDLAIPSLASVLAAACPEESLSDETGIVVGMVRDAGSGVPLPDAQVALSWSRWNVLGEDQPRGQDTPVAVTEGRKRIEVVTDGNGQYRVCTVPVNVTVTATATLLEKSSPKSTFKLENGKEIRQSDIELGIAEAVRLVGRVVDWETAQPVSGATVRLAGTDLLRLTDREGRFTFPEVFPGAYALQIQHIGYGEQSKSIDVGGDGTTEIELRLPSAAIPRESITVTVLSDRERETRAMGTRRDLMVREEIAELEGRARHVGDLIRGRFPNLQVRKMYMTAENQRALHDTPQLCIQSGRRMISLREGVTGCHMVQVYVDGVRIPDPGSYLLNLPANGIESVEVLSPLQAGARYGTGSGRGVLVIYTRGNGPHAGTRR